MRNDGTYAGAGGDRQHKMHGFLVGESSTQMSLAMQSEYGRSITMLDESQQTAFEKQRDARAGGGGSPGGGGQDYQQVAGGI